MIITKFFFKLPTGPAIKLITIEPPVPIETLFRTDRIDPVENSSVEEELEKIETGFHPFSKEMKENYRNIKI